MSMSDTVSYQERIVITIDDRLWMASLAKAERDYNAFQQRLARTKNIGLTITAKDDASKTVDKLVATTAGLTRNKHVVTVSARDDASAALSRISTTATALGRRSVTVNVGVRDNASAQLRAISTSATNLARRAVNVPMGIAGNVAQTVAPELGPVGMGVSAAMMAGGAVAPVLAAGAAMGIATHQAMDFNQQMVQLQNNTTLQKDDMDVLRTNVLQLSQTYGLSTTSLMGAARQIQDLTQNTAAMNAIMSVASETAASTGADVSQTGNILASALHQYKQDQGDVTTVQANAVHMMGVLHVASAEGNMTMQQFADSTGRAIGIAGQLGVPIEQVAAAQAALTRNGYDAAQAQTQVVNIMTRIIHPAKDAENQIKALAKSSGVDLVSAYSATGVQTLGLTGIFARTTQAYKNMGMSQAEATAETLNLMNAQRGGLGEALLLGKGASDYDQILKDLTNTQMTDTYVQQAWARSLEQPSTQLEIIKQRINVFMVNMGNQFIPAVLAGIDAAGKLGEGLGTLGGHVGDVLGPLLGVTSPMDFFNQVVNSAQDGLAKLNNWFGIFSGEIQNNGSIGLLADAFHNVWTNLGPVVDLLNPFRDGISSSDGPTATLANSAGSAADAFHSMAQGIKDVSTQLAPLVEFLKNTESTLNNITKSGVGIGQGIRGALGMPQNTPATTAANVSQVAGLPGNALGFLGRTVGDAGQAVGSAWDWAQKAAQLGWADPYKQGQAQEQAYLGMGQQNLMTPEETQAAVAAAQSQGAQVVKGFTTGVGTSANSVHETGTTIATNVSEGMSQGLDSHSPSRVFMKHGSDVVQGLIDGISGRTTDLPPVIQAMVEQIKTSFTSALGNASGMGGSANTQGGDVTSWLTTAIEQVSKAGGSADMSWLPGLQKLVGMESSGNPLAVNPTAVGGQHATGLLQTLPSTFQANAMAGHSNINDPVDNAIAAIQYIQRTYGSVYSTPAFKGGQYQGYASGGWLSEPVFGVGSVSNKLYGFAERGPERIGASPRLLSAGGPMIQAGHFSPQFTLIQQPGEDGAALAERVSAQIASLMPDYFNRFADHVGTALGNIPEESFG